MNSESYIYVVKCRVSPKKMGYYVGQWCGNDVNYRWQQHRNGTGSNFTKKYKPITFTKVGRFKLGVANRMENLLTKYYLSKVGFRFCRGGNHLNMRPNCHQLSQLKWWLPFSLRAALVAGHLGQPDADPVF